MKKQRSYSQSLKNQVKRLRSKGKTYSEINTTLKTDIPKGTLNSWCKNVPLPKFYKKKVTLLSKINLEKARKKALRINKEKRQKYLNSLRLANQDIAKKVKNKEIAKIALSMLCLGEASKYSRKHAAFTLGSSDIRIILIFLKLLEYCFDDFNLKKIRCTVQCRADQDTKRLKNYWMKTTGVPEHLFYKTRVDPRTIGKKTRKKDYKGVLKVDYFSTKTHLDVESLADLIFENIVKGP